MRHLTKIAAFGAAITLLSSAAGYAQGLGGTLNLSVGTGSFGDLDDANSSNLDNASFEFFEASGSLGYGFGGGFGLQLDAFSENSRIAGQSDSNDTLSSGSMTLHATYKLGTYTLGAFIGKTFIAESMDGDEIDVNSWYGVEAAAEFGNFLIAGQIGQSTHENGHSSLDYKDETFGTLAGHYFYSDMMMFSGGIGMGNGIIHDDQMRYLQVDASMSYAFANGSMYGTIGLQHRRIESDDNQGSGADTRVKIGLTIPFGGSNGSLRDIYTNYTPMIVPTIPSQVALYTTVYD